MKAPLGFSFREKMAGTWAPPGGGPERSIEFALDARAADLLRFAHDDEVELSGTVALEGLCEGAPARGTMLLAPLTRGLIRYELTFTGDDGKPYRLEGQKNVRWTALAASLTNLSASILAADSGAEVGRAELRFDLRADLIGFLRSWRPVLGG
jgi:hypothetical protein